MRDATSFPLTPPAAHNSRASGIAVGHLPSRPSNTSKPHPQRPNLSRMSFGWNQAKDPREWPVHVRSWLAHVETGRIGTTPKPAPEVIAQREKNEQLFRELARG